MNDLQWKAFSRFREEFRSQVEAWSNQLVELSDLQKQAAHLAKTPAYPFETPVVYNRALDEITQADDIKLIVIGDNPGKDEQLLKNNKYLVGQAGKIAEGYFKRNPELGIDFRKNVIILNKTPVHSAKTAQLKTIAKLGGEQAARLVEESQIWMAEKTAELHKNLQPGTELWLVGYSELKEKRIFTGYRDALKKAYDGSGAETDAWEKVFVFQHFSMNRFSIDLNEYMEKNKKSGSLEENIHELGTLHKKEIFN